MLQAHPVHATGFVARIGPCKTTRSLSPSLAIMPSHVRAGCAVPRVQDPSAATVLAGRALEVRLRTATAPGSAPGAAKGTLL